VDGLTGSSHGSHQSAGSSKGPRLAPAIGRKAGLTSSQKLRRSRTAVEMKLGGGRGTAKPPT
jgi:hypothetical protein